MPGAVYPAAVACRFDSVSPAAALTWPGALRNNIHSAMSDTRIGGECLRVSHTPGVSCCLLQRGLAPRVFQYLFSEIDKAQDENVSGLAACGQQQGQAAASACSCTYDRATARNGQHRTQCLTELRDSQEVNVLLLCCWCVCCVGGCCAVP
jgi:hypothetical protein